MDGEREFEMRIGTKDCKSNRKKHMLISKIKQNEVNNNESKMQFMCEKFAVQHSV